MEDDLRAAEKKNELAKEELRQEKPDYFKVCKLACEANEAADKILIQARTEHEAAERLRAKVVSARRDASARVSIARKYVEDHYPVVKTEARSFLNNAIQALQQADITNDINSQILSFVNAESAADRAYSLAQRDVNNSWERPQSSAGRPNMNPPNIGIPTILFPTMGHSSGSNQSWGSSRPSSSSGNTIRRGGGGSSSWGAGSGGFKGGGGSSRGGGSSGW